MLCLMLILFSEAHTVSLYSWKTKQKEDIILDGKLYRPVGDNEGDRESKIVGVLKWLLSPFINLWTHQDDHNKNERPFKPKFPFLSKTEFKPKYGRNSNSFKEKLKPYKPRYLFRTEHDKFFSQRVSWK